MGSAGGVASVGVTGSVASASLGASEVEALGSSVEQAETNPRSQANPRKPLIQGLWSSGAARSNGYRRRLVGSGRAPLKVAKFLV